jgi:hypothetical protein
MTTAKTTQLPTSLVFDGAGWADSYGDGAYNALCVSPGFKVEGGAA